VRQSSFLRTQPYSMENLRQLAETEAVVEDLSQTEGISGSIRQSERSWLEDVKPNVPSRNLVLTSSQSSRNLLQAHAAFTPSQPIAPTGGQSPAGFTSPSKRMGREGDTGSPRLNKRPNIEVDTRRMVRDMSSVTKGVSRMSSNPAPEESYDFEERHSPTATPSELLGRDDRDIPQPETQPAHRTVPVDSSEPQAAGGATTPSQFCTVVRLLNPAFQSDNDQVPRIISAEDNLTQDQLQHVNAWFDNCVERSAAQFERWFVKSMEGGSKCLGNKIITKSDSEWPEQIATMACKTCVRTRRPCFVLEEALEQVLIVPSSGTDSFGY
jgi:hypothetical protein